MTHKIGRRAMFGTTFATLSCAALAAVAQPAMGPGRGHGGGPGMMGGRGAGMMGRSWDTKGYLDALKSQLGITVSQEPAWKEYADKVSGVGEQMQGLHQTMFEVDGHGLMAGAPKHDEQYVRGATAGLRPGA